MDTKNLNIIEFNKITEMAATRAVCRETRELICDELPLTDAEDVAYLLKQTDVVAHWLVKRGTPRISSCEGADAAVRRAAKGGVLSMAELLSVGAALRNFSALINWFTPVGEDTQERVVTPMDDLFYTITPQQGLEKDIHMAILSDTVMADSASDELYDLRRKILKAESSIRDKLDAVVKSPNNAKYLQDALVSIRNGRFVVPVRSEHRSEIAGVIHDVSQSGGTVFIEPAAVVEANAKIMQLRNAEMAEVERILGEFSQRVADIEPIYMAAYDAMIQVDMRLAKAALGLEMNGICPKVRKDTAFKLIKARHPLLDAKTAVPVDIRLGEEYDTLIITGPNTGGKTVSLKTAGLLLAMAQAGYLLPAHDETEICVFNDILADIGDEQSIEQSLSTFSGHIKKITEILKITGARSLVLMDELGAGTDPAEGAALAVAIIESLRQTGARIMATTHYAELKMFALETEGVQNAGSEFDIETLRPTYRLIVGVPGRSNAFLIGEKLGVPTEVLESARRHLSGEQRRFESVLGQLQDIKLEMNEQKEEIENLRSVADKQLEDAKQKRDELIKQGERELAEARRKAKALADEVQNEAYAMMDEMKRAQKDKRVSDAQKAQLARQIANKRAPWLAKSAGDDSEYLSESYTPLTEAVVGQEVWVPAMGKGATVTTPPTKQGMVEVRIGALKTKLPLTELCEKSQKLQDKQVKGRVTNIKSGDATARSAQNELHLLGKTVEEAIMELDTFLSGAMMNKISTVYVIHGRGTGALRSAVAQYLKTAKNVKNYRLGRYGEGEDGVTVVEMKG